MKRKPHWASWRRRRGLTAKPPPSLPYLDKLERAEETVKSYASWSYNCES